MGPVPAARRRAPTGWMTGRCQRYRCRCPRCPSPAISWTGRLGRHRSHRQLCSMAIGNWAAVSWNMAGKSPITIVYNMCIHIYIYNIHIYIYTNLCVYSWENHQLQRWVFQQTTFDLPESHIRKGRGTRSPRKAMGKKTYWLESKKPDTLWWTYKKLLKMAIYSGFFHSTLWFSIVMLVYQRVSRSFFLVKPLLCCYSWFGDDQQKFPQTDST